MIIGLTGKVSTGKSFVASCFKKLGASVFDADFIVHQLYKVDKKIINYVERNFPDVVNNGKVDRSLLSKYFLMYDQNWQKFESLVHSAVAHKLRIFLSYEWNINRKLIVLDIPLLLETKLHLYCDFLVFIHTNRVVQYRRRNIDSEKFKLICELQLPTQLKKKLSDCTINAGVNRGHAFLQVKEIVDFLGSVHL
ncbi:dephospho-CoA kinase [Wolbachia pipientis]|uniref:Dephospho-CoA kinase n=1 Tax=Wolbachia pipientis TaxID=955 RepID=A0A1E7QJM8_WOLPI|nr:dephospho-CoA kinase [Wolbachia pipientis]OEY86673.1 dephospho-CoA kinase [Wolbachia pipientis]